MTAAQRVVAPAGAREFAFTNGDFKRFAALIYSISGIVLGEAKSQLVYSRLAKRVRATGCEDFAAYMALVSSDDEERDAAVYALTTNHTKFFREDHHFDHFGAAVWPALAARLQAGGKVRLWSAACSSGEEPYSLVMTALGARRDVGGELLRRDLRVLATDLSPDVLRTARAGRYLGDILDAIPQALRSAWVRRIGAQCEIDPELRRVIAFKQLNLLGDWPIKGKFDAIFCRNVMIYFDEPTKARLQERLAHQLAPGGFLYIGHSERLTGPAERMLTPIGHTMYRKVNT
jgi:chemotaxis protein methyltransferase CheR